MAILRSAGMSMASSATSVVHRALEQNHLSEAARIASQYQVFYSPNIYRRGLITAFSKTKDLDAYILFVRSIYDNLPRLENNLPSSQKADAENDNVPADETDTVQKNHRRHD